jgi:hypothetical protein
MSILQIHPSGTDFCYEQKFWEVNECKTSVNAEHTVKVAHTCRVTKYKPMGEFKMNFNIRGKKQL